MIYFHMGRPHSSSVSLLSLRRAQMGSEHYGCQVSWRITWDSLRKGSSIIPVTIVWMTSVRVWSVFTAHRKFLSVCVIWGHIWSLPCSQQWIDYFVAIYTLTYSSKLTPADMFYGRGQAIFDQRAMIKSNTLALRRKMHYDGRVSLSNQMSWWVS